MVGPAVEKLVWQQFKGQGVKVIGIDIWDQSNSALLSFISETGITFPIASGGSQTSKDYNAGNNTLYLIDQQGILQATTGVTDVQTDSTVNAIAAKISELIGVAVARNVRPANVLTPFMTVLSPAPHEVYDLRGRMLDMRRPVSGIRIEPLKGKSAYNSIGFIRR